MEPSSISRDARTLELLRLGDEDGLRRLLNDHSARVLGALRREFRSTLDLPALDDAVGQATANVWRSIHTYDPARGALRTWFHRIARNCALHIIRHERKQVTSSPLIDFVAVVAAADNEEAETYRSELERVVRETISELSPQQRCVLEADLAAGGTADTTALAAELGTSTNSISVSRSKGRAKLKELLEGSGAIHEILGKKEGVS